MLDFSVAGFRILVEVVPPAGPEAGPILAALSALAGVPVHSFTVASNPVAKPRMSALALSSLIQRRTGVPAIMHCTTRDHNRLSAWSVLCGAKALGVETVLVATGDYVALGDRESTTTVRDVDVYELARMARDVGLHAGVVFDPGTAADGIGRQVDRLGRKIEAGAQFAVTQPVYDVGSAERLAEVLAGTSIPIVLGILPLVSARHAEFLHRHVSGITVAASVRQRMRDAEDPGLEGVKNALEMLHVARRCLTGACIMPPFGRYEIVAQMLGSVGGAA